MTTQLQKSGGVPALLDKMKPQLAMALPKHLTPERMIRVALTEWRKTPKLQQCNTTSFLGSIVQASQLGLEPGSALGHCYLVPYKKTCQLIIGFRGMIDLARRSGQIVSLSAHTVHENDEFHYELGLHEDLKHIPAPGERGKMILVYGVAKLTGGGVQFEVMTRGEVDEIRKQSKAGTSGPWKDHYDEMAKKTVIRRLFKYLPVSIELATASMVDEQADRGVQDMTGVISDIGADDIIEADSQSVENLNERFAIQEMPEPRSDKEGKTHPTTAQTIDCPKGDRVMAADCDSCPSRIGCPAHDDEAPPAPSEGSKLDIDI